MYINEEKEVALYFKNYFEYFNNKPEKKNNRKPIEYKYTANIDPFSEELFSVVEQVPNVWSNEINSFGYRSDEFTNSHFGKHVLFSGCSNTYGVGLAKNEMWSRFLYDEINKHEKCSGYFNLGSGGTGIQYLVINLFKYFKNFGNPNIIFLNMPDQLRFIEYIDLTQDFRNIHFLEDNAKNSIFLNYYYYYMLEQYCFSNDIKLYSITWHANPKLKFNTNDVFSKLSLKTFYYIDYDKMMDELVNGEQDSKYKFYDRARDKKHHGVGYNIYWANFLYKKYLENNDNSRN